jgi:hypothetical protein
MFQRLFVLSAFFLGSFQAHAQKLTFTNLDSSDVQKLVKEFSANFTHTSVSGASALGDIFGFEIGVVGGLTSAPNTNSLIKEVDSSQDFPRIPHGALLGAVSVPGGVTLELGFVPSVGSTEFKFQSTSFAAKWTLSTIVPLPVSVALKGHVQKSKGEFSYTDNTNTIAYKYDSTTTGAMVLVSKDLIFVEPYAGLGLINGKGDLSYTAVVPSTVFTGGGSSQNATVGSSQLVIGAELKLLIAKFGVEYARSFGTTSITGKLSAYF